MEQTARNVVRQIYEKYQLTGPFDQPEQLDVKKVMNNSKVTTDNFCFDDNYICIGFGLCKTKYLLLNPCKHWI